MPDHHELPKYYLRGFCTPSTSTSFLWIFERNRSFLPGKKHGVNNPCQRGIRQTGLRKDAYAVRNPNGKVNYEYERQLQQKERIADAAIDKVRKCEAIETCEKDILAGYIGLTWRRISSHDKLVRPLVEKQVTNPSLLKMVQNLAYSGEFGKAYKLQDALEQVQSEEGKNEISRMIMLLDFNKIHSGMMRMRWEFITATPSCYFITTDNPVVFDCHSGLSTSQLLFPISQTVMLVASHHEGTDLSYRQASLSETRKLNAILIRFAECKVYSPYPDEWIHKNMAEGFAFTGSDDNC